jgi:hypothetical protein
VSGSAPQTRSAASLDPFGMQLQAFTARDEQGRMRGGYECADVIGRTRQQVLDVVEDEQQRDHGPRDGPARATSRCSRERRLGRDWRRFRPTQIPASAAGGR